MLTVQIPTTYHVILGLMVHGVMLEVDPLQAAFIEAGAKVM